MTVIRGSNNKNSATNPALPPQQRLQPHTVAAVNLPTLESAPPSANFEGFATAAAQAASDQFQAAFDVLSGGIDVFSGPSASPPPAPAHEGSTTTTMPNVTAPTTTHPNNNVRISFGSRPLPPPPNRLHHPLDPPPRVVFQQPPPTVAPLPPPPPPRLGAKPTSPQQQRTTPATTTTTTFETALPNDQPPPFLSKAHFRSNNKQLQVTATRQERLPVLIVATENAHRMAWKNGLRLSDLLQGLYSTTASQQDTPLLAPFRSVTRSLTLHWEQLQVQFSEDMAATPDDVAVLTLQRVAALQEQDGNLQHELALLEDQIDNLLSSEDHHTNAAAAAAHTSAADDYQAAVEQHQQVVTDAFRLTSPLTIPWLRRYRQAADDCTDHLQHEQFDCPAIILTICTTAEEASGNVVETLRALQLTHYLPIQFRNGMFDPESIRQEVLVLHDNVAGPKDWDETALRTQLKVSFGAGSAILRINSLAPETAAVLATEEESDLWGGGGALGNCLTVADRARMRKYLANLVTASILPALERRIADLNVIVSDRKKGVKNVLKSFWGGRKKEDDDVTVATAVTSSSSDIKYRYDSVESQTRLLADTLFLMRDYEAAHSMYRLIKDDFKQDKNWSHYASVHEMMALSLYMSDPYGRAKEIFSSIENALLSYSKAAEEAQAQWGEKPGRASIAPVATRLATRLCLVLISTRNICSGRHLEVADLLASASSHETALGAAVLLEQSSAHYYKAEMYRKYAFHMLMSGHMFRTAEQEHHAFRCFTSALYIYRDGKWEELHNHLRSALAAQLFSMGRMAISLQLYAKLVGTTDGGRVSVKSQQKFVNNLLEICNDHTKKALAGADRMAAPSTLSGAERDSVRNERLNRIVQVVRYTKSASRALELPNMDLPCVNDSTVTVIAEEAAQRRQESVPSFGEAHVGSPEVWDELMLTTIAELKASVSSNFASGDKITMNKTLSKIEDPDIKRVIALIDEEKANRSKLERTKKSATYTDSAPVRALKEPIAVELTLSNPLGIPIDIYDLQLVARMTAEYGNRTCTNEDAVNIRPLVVSNEKEKWFFQSSSVEFGIAEFCRVSSGSDDPDKEAWKSAEDVEPFFVVSKSNVTLEPESKMVVSTSICPLALGNLEVMGVRCRLFDSVWVYHPFDIKGPLLQNTRANRANRVRGESFLLKSKVEQGMPCLTVDLIYAGPSTSGSSGPVLQEQIGKWILRVTNVGTSAGSNITLKTNLPWINILEGGVSKPIDEVDEKRPTSCCVGPTGTLMAIPMLGSSLKTGETIDVPIEIKTSGSGKQDFYMLFRYELPDSPNQELPRCRWLKKMFSVPVYPSLTLSAGVSAAFAVPKEHILSLELTNCRTDRPDQLEVKLNKLTIASCHYALEPFPGQTSSVSVAALGWQERTSVHFKVTHREVENTAPLLTQCPISSLDEDNSADAVVSSSILDFLSLERSHDDFQEALRLHQMALARAAAQGDDDRQPRTIAAIRRANTGDLSSFGGTDMAGDCRTYVKAHPTSIARLCPTEGSAESIHLVCSWSAQNGAIHGHHHIRGLPVRPLKINKGGCPITITASHPTSVSNNFDTGPAMVPIKVTLRNRLVDAMVEVELAVDSPDTFDFTGPERYRTALGGGEEVSIPLKALLPEAGVYNLQKVRLTVDTGEPVPVSYLFPLQWIVTVNSI